MNTKRQKSELQNSPDVPSDVIPFTHSAVVYARRLFKKNHIRNKSCLSLKSTDRSHVFPSSFLLLFNQRASRGASTVTYDSACARICPYSRGHDVEVNSHLVEPQRTESGGEWETPMGSIEQWE